MQRSQEIAEAVVDALQDDTQSFATMGGAGLRVEVNETFKEDLSSTNQAFCDNNHMGSTTAKEESDKLLEASGNAGMAFAGSQNYQTTVDHGHRQPQYCMSLDCVEHVGPVMKDFNICKSRPTTGAWNYEKGNLLLRHLCSP